MKLIIDTLAKVFKAEVEFDGITVIAGANNTGKSTVGKALWAMFTAFSNLDSRVNDARKIKYQSLLDDFEERFTDGGLEESTYDVSEELVTEGMTFERLRQILESSADKDLETPDYDEWLRRFQEVAELSVDSLKCQEVLSEIASVFHSQCGSFLFPGTYPSIELRIKNKALRFEATGSVPKCDFGVKLQHKAFYIDSPNALLEVRNAVHMRRFDFPWGVYRRRSSLSRTLIDGVRSCVMREGSKESNSVDELLIAKKFSQIEGRLKELMGGTLSYSKDRGLQFVDNNFPAQPLKIDNLSQGVKSMALLQAAFMKGAIGDSDVLILDEPEIHLHPVWQIKYAELIVMLQKEFNLTVLLTSHSPDFVEAIRLYSKKHGIKGSLKGYLSSVAENGSVTLDPVNGENWDVVFETFGSSFDELMKLRSELELKNV